MINSIFLVGLGGGLGSIARYLCQRWFTQAHPGDFPWGTFVVNITGCLLIGIIWGVSMKWLNFAENWKLFLMTGFCGGFTTFSAFALEGTGLIREEKIGIFLVYAGASVILGLLATYVGFKISRL